MVFGAGKVLAQGSGASAGKDYVNNPLQLLLDCAEAQKKVTGFTCIFTKRERIEGHLREPETMFVKCRYSPFSVYFKWVKNPNKDREVLYFEGRYEDKVQAHQPLGPLNIEKKMVPNSPDALKESLRPVTQAGFRNVLDAMIKVTTAAKTAGDLHIFCIQDDMCNSRPAYFIIRKLPKKAGYPYFLLYVYIDKEWMVPVRISAFDWDDNLVSCYTFSDVKLNAPLTDADFDKENKDYNWPAFIFQKLKFEIPKKK
jgi:hypothetical protein